MSRDVFPARYTNYTHVICGGSGPTARARPFRPGRHSLRSVSLVQRRTRNAPRLPALLRVMPSWAGSGSACCRGSDYRSPLLSSLVCGFLLDPYRSRSSYYFGSLSRSSPSALMRT